MARARRLLTRYTAILDGDISMETKGWLGLRVSAAQKEVEDWPSWMKSTARLEGARQSSGSSGKLESQEADQREEAVARSERKVGHG